MEKKDREIGTTGTTGTTWTTGAAGTEDGTGGKGQPLEDRALKEAARIIGEELLPMLGIAGQVKRTAPTEQVFLEIQDFLMDFTYEMEDGSWCHLEFESDSIKTDDLRRFRACDAVLSYHHKVVVNTVVLCSSKVVRIRERLTEGKNVYWVQVIRLKDRDADGVIHELEEQKRAGAGLEREDFKSLLLTPLMSGEMAQGERIGRSLVLLEDQRERLGREELIGMQSVLYAFAMKFWEKEELEKIRRILKMTILGQMLTEDARREGEAVGRREGEAVGRREGETVGRIQGRAGSVLDLLGEIGGVASTLSEKIMGEQDDAILRRWLLLAAKVDSVEQFEQMM